MMCLVFICFRFGDLSVARLFRQRRANWFSELEQEVTEETIEVFMIEEFGSQHVSKMQGRRDEASPLQGGVDSRDEVRG
jgi:hypothetical protein